MRLQFWLFMVDVAAVLGIWKLWIYAVGKAGQYTDWGHGEDCSAGTGELPW